MNACYTCTFVYNVHAWHTYECYSKWERAFAHSRHPVPWFYRYVVASISRVYKLLCPFPPPQKADVSPNPGGLEFGEI